MCFFSQQLKEKVGVNYITCREVHLLKLARKRLGTVRNLAFLGNGIYNDTNGTGEVVHLPILSFLFRAPPELGGYLHHNFVCSLLNDMVSWCISKEY